MKKKAPWYRVDVALEHAESKLMLAEARKSELDRLKAYGRPPAEVLSFTSLDDIPDWILVHELAKKMKCSSESIRRDIRTGELPAQTRGRDYLIDPKHIGPYMALVEERRRRKRA